MNTYFVLSRFVLVNSIALEGDECSMCTEAMSQLKTVATKLTCHKHKARAKTSVRFWENHKNGEKMNNSECEIPDDAPAPILIQVSSTKYKKCFILMLS